MFKILKYIKLRMLKMLGYGLFIILFSNASAFADFKCPKTGGIFKTVHLAYPSMDAGVRANPVYYISLKQY